MAPNGARVATGEATQIGGVAIEPTAHAPIGHNAGPPLQPETEITGLKLWTTPILTEIPYTDELRRLYAVPAPNDLSIPEFLRRSVQ